VENISKSYGRTTAVAGVTLSLWAGEIWGFVGANGAGKTTTLRAVSGMVHTTGDIRFRGQSLAGRATEDIVRLGIAHVPQGRGTFVSQTVEENLQIGAMSRRDRAGISADIERAYGYFPRLRERRKQQAGTLSGGEQQMLAIGRCLMGKPRLIMFDEPSLGLAPAIVQQIFRIVRRLNEEGLTILLVEQNVMASLKIARRGYVLENGRIEMSGSGTELLGNDRVRQAYLGL